MKLRNKLIVSFCIMVVLPVLMSIAVVCGLFHIQTKKMNDLYHVQYKSILTNIYSPAIIMGQITEQAYEEVCDEAKSNPSKFNDQGYLDELSAALKEKLSGIIVRKNGTITYVSCEWREEDLEKILPSYKEQDEQSLSDVGVYKGGNYQMLIKQVSTESPSGDKYSIFIVTALNQMLPQLKTFLIQGACAIVLVMILTSATLCIWVYRSILQPVDKLKLATNNIKNGNLDFVMPKVSGDEIGDVCRDFEEMRVILKQSMDDKVNSDREEKELIRNISHDLRTPLTTIKGYAEGLLDGIVDTPERREKYLKTIIGKVNGMDKLIDELTIYSKLDTNRVPYSFSPVNIRAYFADCCDELRMELEEKGITLDYTYHANHDIITVADSEQLKRVIYNIINNSAKYMTPERQGRICIDIYDEGEYAHIVIKDNGKGIGMQELPHIFERFYRADRCRNSQRGGSGIGLAIVKKIIDDHKGKIWAESVEGEGTTMHLNLKVQEDDGILRLEDKE